MQCSTTEPQEHSAPFNTSDFYFYYSTDVYFLFIIK